MVIRSISSLSYSYPPGIGMENNGGLLDSRAKVGKRGRGAAGD